MVRVIECRKCGLINPDGLDGMCQDCTRKCFGDKNET